MIQRPIPRLLVSVTHAGECFNSTTTLSVSRKINLYQLPLRLFLPLFWPFSRQSRSQLGAATVLATQVRGAVCSVGGGDFSLEVEGDGDDDDGT